MAKGTIKTIITEKGFGFITPEGAKPGEKVDVFFHFSGLVGGLRLESLHQGDVVEFTTEDGDRGKKAVNVKLASDDSESDGMPADSAEEMGDEEDDQNMNMQDAA